jgi:8-oxo-dGTP diphosphatase
VVSAERFRLAAAVYGVLIDGDRVLLLRRTGSGYRDGQLSLPAGHLDGGEDAVAGLARELREELTIDADPDSCMLAVVVHRAAERIDDHEYIDLFFTVGTWTGTPSIGEPDKSTDLLWARLDQLPADVVDYVRAALHALHHNQPLVLFGWPVTIPQRLTKTRHRANGRRAGTYESRQKRTRTAGTVVCGRRRGGRQGSTAPRRAERPQRQRLHGHR